MCSSAACCLTQNASHAFCRQKPSLVMIQDLLQLFLCPQIPNLVRDDIFPSGMTTSLLLLFQLPRFSVVFINRCLTVFLQAVPPEIFFSPAFKVAHDGTV